VSRFRRQRSVRHGVTLRQPGKRLTNDLGGSSNLALSDVQIDIRASRLRQRAAEVFDFGEVLPSLLQDLLVEAGDGFESLPAFEPA
jgi:hypothetical protein